VACEQSKGERLMNLSELKEAWAWSIKCRLERVALIARTVREPCTVREKKRVAEQMENAPDIGLACDIYDVLCENPELLDDPEIQQLHAREGVVSDQHMAACLDWERTFGGSSRDEG
jgi:hypothetical protein